MANITLDLNKFKASGVYTVEIDASESVVLNTQTIRLVVGFSRTGPFNAPVFLKNSKDARTMFGDIDKTLEKRGSFFHRSLFTALEVGPVYALNLLSLENTPDGDKIDYRSFSLDTASDNGDITPELLSSFYNKERFWKADDEYFQALVDANATNNGKLLSFTNLLQTPTSIFVRKANVQGFDLTARAFYGSSDVQIPEYIKEFDYISDYFLEVIIVKGDWTNYESLSIDPDYSNYFDTRGLKVDQLDNFLSNESVVKIASLEGCIIPDFTDKNGTNHSLDTIVNNASPLTGIFMTLNREMLDRYDVSDEKVDLIGHNLIDSGRSYINFLSYTSPISEELTYTQPDLLSSDMVTYSATVGDFPNDPILTTEKNITVTDNAFGGTSGYFKNLIEIPKPLPSADTFTLEYYNSILDNSYENTLFKTTSVISGFEFVKVEQVVNTGSSIQIQVSHPEKASDGIIELTPTEIDNSGIVGTHTFKFLGTYSNVTKLYLPLYDTYFTVGSIDTTTDPTSSIITVDEEIISTSLDEMLLWDSVNNKLDIDTNSGREISVIYDSEYISEFIDAGVDNYIISPTGSQLYKDVLNSIVIDGDTILNNAGNPIRWITANPVINVYGQSCIAIREYMNEELTTQAIDSDFISFNESYNKEGTIAGAKELILQSSYGDIEKNVEIVPGTMNANLLEFKIPVESQYDIEVGQFIVTKDYIDNPSHFTKVTDKIKTFNTSTGITEFIIKVGEPVKLTGSKVTRYLPIAQFADRLQPTYLPGFKIREYHLPSTAQQQEKIYGVLENTNVGTTLKDKQIIQFRYIVDTMEGIIAPNMGAKTILTKLAKARGICLAFVNAPSMKQFADSVDPRFTNLPDPENGIPKPVFKTEYVTSGGNLSLGPSYKFTLPTEELGSKYVGVFFPNLLLREDNKNISIPPAADVSNNFVVKFINGNPYKIVAGEKRGVISNPKIIGVEYELLTEDRENLEPMGLNLITTSKKVGPMIYTNNLAYQNTLSAFNNLHVRDLLITLEENIEQILSAYIWEFNDAPTRLEIKSLVDRYLSTVKNSRGIYEFLTVMNSQNNTPEIIGQRFGIIDIGIEPAMGLQKVINRMSILKTGTISSGGFTIV